MLYYLQVWIYTYHILDMKTIDVGKAHVKYIVHS